VSDSEVSADLMVPADVVDLLLWRDAQEMPGRRSTNEAWTDRPPRSDNSLHAARNSGPFDPPTFHPR